MTGSKRTKIFLVLGLVFVLLFTHLPVVYTLLYHDLTGAPTTAGGNVDLTAGSPARKIVLDGSWEFYWDRLIETEPRKDDRADFFIIVPDYWSRYKTDGNWLPAGGFGSYRLTLRGLSWSAPVTIFIPDLAGAYRVFVDGQLTAESGVISKDVKKIFTVPRAKLYPVTLSGEKTHEVVIEAASARFSGLYMAPVLMDYESALRQNSGRTDVRFLLFGTVLFSLLALVVTYMISFRNGIRSAWLPMMIVFVLLRIMLTTEFYGFWQGTVFFNLSYENVNPLMFFVTFALKFLLIFMVQEQFGVPFSRREKLGFFLYYAALYAIYLFVPYGVYNRHLAIALPAATFALDIYAFFKIYFGSRGLKKYGLLMYCGFLLAVSGLIINSYYLNGVIYPDMSLALLTLLAAYLMIVSLVYVLRTVDMRNQFAESSYMLRQAKSQIDMQKEYYDALREQINEVHAIKHDVRHFVGVMKRLSDEGRYEELGRFLSEYAVSTDTEPFPIFCENVVANSILGYYSLKAKERGIIFHCDCAIPRQLSVSDSDLCIVLGNALENAVEACARMGSEEAKFISVNTGTVNGQLLIKIENSYNGRLIIRDGAYLSVKNGDFHGIGVQNIKRVVEGCGGFICMEHSEIVFTFMAAFPCSPSSSILMG